MRPESGRIAGAGTWTTDRESRNILRCPGNFQPSPYWVHHWNMIESRRDDWKIAGIAPRPISSRPYGTFRLSNLYPGLRPGLSSAVPAGLMLQSIGSRRLFSRAR